MQFHSALGHIACHAAQSRETLLRTPHVTRLTMKYISSKPRRIGLSSFLRKNDQRRSALSRRIERKEWPNKCIDKRQPSCHHLNFQGPPHSP
ncbi:hypothetical protein PoB_005354700 [Plakobranchus ocellatus]|uniref:Uncharacterized protein n=1 Tax=Plakobranchus ocellatus TaxID=259542 RepID=A0AAV4C625_9GAST|nr:hypothetical protein PoB_005354700 [Plakobranchus ocellatus]